jgi:hypothetical protein
MPEDALLCALPLADRLRIAAVDLAVTGAPRALVEAVWAGSASLESSTRVTALAGPAVAAAEP